MTPLLLALPLIATAPVPKDFKRATTELDGTWESVSFEYDGRPLNQASTWRFDGPTYRMQNAGHPPGQPIPLRVDAKASPKRFDFNDTQFGIYRITGDTLVICMGGVPNVRPTDFDGGPATFRYTFKRATGKEPPEANR